jgi:hypothetical protein
MSDVRTDPAATPTTSGPVISPNVPQSVSYSGQHYIELALPADWFVAGAQAAATASREEA